MYSWWSERNKSSSPMWPYKVRSLTWINLLILWSLPFWTNPDCTQCYQKTWFQLVAAHQVKLSAKFYELQVETGTNWTERCNQWFPPYYYSTVHQIRTANKSEPMPTTVEWVTLIAKLSRLLSTRYVVEFRITIFTQKNWMKYDFHWTISIWSNSIAPHIPNKSAK